jgi:hypothetical protein
VESAGPAGCRPATPGWPHSEAFLKLMVAQLRYQNPMSPSDPAAMMAQTSQLAQLDAVQQLANLQRRDLGLQNAVAAAGLVGTDVTAMDFAGETVRGTVDAVRYTTLGPILEIGGREVPFDNVSEIRRPTGVQPPTGPSNPTDPTDPSDPTDPAA